MKHVQLQKITLENINISKLLKYDTLSTIAKDYNVTEKVVLSKLKEELDSNSFSYVLGYSEELIICEGAWMKSKERYYYLMSRLK